MRRPIISKFTFWSIRGIVCITLSLTSMFILPGLGRTQSLDKFTIKSDRNKPLEAPKKTTTPAKSQSKNTDQTRTAPQDAIFAPLSGCVYNDILVLDTIRIVFIQLFNYPQNSAIPVTVTQTNTGVVGYALTSYDPETKIPVVGFDMGGTSTGDPILNLSDNCRRLAVCGEV